MCTCRCGRRVPGRNDGGFSAEKIELPLGGDHGAVHVCTCRCGGRVPGRNAHPVSSNLVHKLGPVPCWQHGRLRNILCCDVVWSAWEAA